MRKITSTYLHLSNQEWNVLRTPRSLTPSGLTSICCPKRYDTKSLSFEELSLRKSPHLGRDWTHCRRSLPHRRVDDLLFMLLVDNLSVYSSNLFKTTIVTGLPKELNFYLFRQIVALKFWLLSDEHLEQCPPCRKLNEILGPCSECQLPVKSCELKCASKVIGIIVCESCCFRYVGFNEVVLGLLYFLLPLLWGLWEASRTSFKDFFMSLQAASLERAAIQTLGRSSTHNLLGHSSLSLSQWSCTNLTPLFRKQGILAEHTEIRRSKFRQPIRATTSETAATHIPAGQCLLPSFYGLTSEMAWCDCDEYYQIWWTFLIECPSWWLSTTVTSNVGLISLT